MKKRLHVRPPYGTVLADFVASESAIACAGNFLGAGSFNIMSLKEFDF